ncbi:aldo/keto reductase [Verrucomicrobiaceae bacterium R5-34]|nr:aldo/keto reductase [Verrucomicrobiaceae bacterium R5-34]
MAHDRAMKQNRLGQSGIVVSEICMGTMTFGQQCDQALSNRIMDRSVDAGIDFFDAAEIYPVPPSKELAGLTETWVGEWMKGKDRDSLIIATKVAGAAHGWFNPPVRGGKAALDRHHIRKAVEGSLRRLQTDYIDLYQVHWPDHGMRCEDTLAALDELVEEGLVRAIGVSNETSYGLMKSLWTSDTHGLTRYDTIQNNFSISNRRFEDELAEVCRHENVSLLPYSPLAGGVLSGKYNDGKLPEGARFSDYLKNGQPRQKAMASRFVNDKSLETTARMIEIAKEADMDVVTLATAWSKQHDFVASTIVGASCEEQLDAIFAAADLTLDDEVMAAIDAVTKEILYPMH